MADAPVHHIIYGTLTDFLTGAELTDTDDERYRQQLAEFMVKDKGFSREELEPRLCIETTFNNQYVKSTIDLTVRLEGRRMMIIRYGPGSLVTRERPAIAAARMLDPDYRIPLAVVTNGRDAEILDTLTGKVLNSGISGIPDRTTAAGMLNQLVFEPFTDKKKREKEARILNAFDLDICCRGGVCELNNT